MNKTHHTKKACDTPEQANIAGVLTFDEARRAAIEAVVSGRLPTMGGD
jgi:hypothetical protein